MTPLAASMLGYVLGLMTALLIGACWAVVRGGQDGRDHDRRRAERLATKARW